MSFSLKKMWAKPYMDHFLNRYSTLKIIQEHLMWLNCCLEKCMHDLRSFFSMVVQSDQDHERIMINDCMQWNSFIAKKMSKT